MNNITRKFLSSIIILIFIGQVIFPIVGMECKVSIAESTSIDLDRITETKDLLNGKKYFAEYQGFKGIDKIKIYAPVDTKSRFLNEGGSYILEVYDKTPIQIKMDGTNDFQTDLYIRDKVTGQYRFLNTISAGSFYTYSVGEVNSFDKLTQAGGEYAIQVVKKNKKQYGDNSISDMLRIRMVSEEIVLSKYNNSANNSGTQCNNAAIFDNVLYVRPNSKIYLSEKDGSNSNKGTLYIDQNANGFSVGNQGSYHYIESPSTIGASTKLRYNRASSNCYRKVVVSNLSTGNAKITAGKTNLVGGMHEGYYTKREVGAKLNKDYTIKAMLKKQFSGSDVEQYSMLTITDLTNCLNFKPVVTFDSVTLEHKININAKKAGVIKVSARDYLNNVKDENWYVCPSNNTAIETVVEEDTGISDTDSVDYYDYEGEVIENVVAPTIYINSNRDKNELTFDVNIDNCTGSKFKMIKRTNQSVCTALQSNYYDFDGIGYAVPDHFKEEYNIKDFEDGVYDFVVFAKNGDDSNYASYAVGPYYLGEKEYIEIPEITPLNDKNVIDKKSGINKYSYSVKNCTNLKYLVIKRKDPSKATDYDEYAQAGFDAFKGTEIKNPKEFSIQINATETGSGVYDIIVWGINNYKEYDNFVAYLGVKINVEPIVSISVDNKENKVNYKKIDISSKSIDKDQIKKSYYYIHKKSSKSDYASPQITTITNPQNARKPDVGGEFKGETTLVIDDSQKFGTGYYDVTVYAEDEFGTCKLEHYSNILIDHGPGIDINIEGEETGEVSSISNRSKQTINIVPNDIDDNEELTVKYFVTNEEKYTEKDLQESGKKLFENAQVLKAKAKNGENLKLDIYAEDGKDENKYVYIQVTDKYGVSSFSRTGSIRLNGNDLQLNRIYSLDELNTTEKIGYGLNNVYTVTLQFDRDLDNNFPDLYMKFGEYETKQDKAVVNKNEITYYYTITEKYGNGEISIGNIDYSKNAFKESNSSKEYKKDIKTDKNVKNDVDSYYIVDTTRPEVESIEFQIKSGDKNVVRDEANNLIYMTDFEDFKIVVKYTEPIKGIGAAIRLTKGGKLYIGNYPIDKDTRDEDIYDFTDLLKEEDINKFEGDIVFEDFIALISDARDSNNNRVKYVGNNIKYTLDGVDVSNKKIIFDSSVYQPEIYTNTTRVEEDVTFIKDTEFTCFAEFNEKQNYEDVSGLKDIKLQISHNSEIAVKDKNNNIVQPTSVANSQQNNSKISTYKITDTNILPVSFVANEVGTYKIVATKEDNLNNKSENEKEIVIKDGVSIIKEESGLSLDKEEYYNFKLLTEKENEFNLLLNIENTTPDNVKVYVEDKTGKKELLKLIKQENEDSAIKAQYKFNIYKGGQYNIKVENLNKKILLNDYITVDNVYIVGDIDNDGKVTVKDLVELMRYLARFSGYDTYQRRYAGDIDGNGTTDVRDAVLLARFVGQDIQVYVKPDGHFATY